MKNLSINVSRETRMVDLPKQFISVDGENLQSKLIFTFIDEFVNGQARLEYEIRETKNYITLNKENEAYTIPVKNIVTKAGQIDMQLVITEGTDEEEIPVFKSNKFYLYCNASINAVDKAPDGYELWIEQANVKLNQIDNLDIDIENSVVTITKKDGTKKSENVKGDNGIDGYTPVKGTDYFTEEEQEEFKQDIETKIKPTLDNNLEQAKDYADSIKPTKTSELTNDSNFAFTNSNNNFSASQTINGTLTVNGDIVQNGESYETHAEQVYTEKDEIITRNGAVGGLSENQLTGIRAKTYDGTNDGQLGFDANGEARVGDVNDTQPLLTRDEIVNLSNGQVLIWDGTNLRAIGSNDFIKNTDVASMTKFGVAKMWTSTNEDGEIGLNISTEV